jgi:hypothetical protein
MSPRVQIPRRITDERGYVLVVVMALMVVALAGAFALLASTLSAQQLTTRDTRVRSAQQAADAGLQATLYEQSETNLGSTYNDNGGVLGLSNFLDCDVPQLSASGQVTGIVSLNAGTGGVCPQGETGSGTATSNWQSLGNHTYYQAESVPNETQFEHGSSGGSSSEDLEFPEFVAVGCSAATITDCENNDSSPTAQYWREEVILQPVSPLQAIEGMGNVTISGLSALGLGEATLNGDVQTLGKLTTPTALLGLNTALASSGLVPTLAASSFGGTIVSTAQEVTATPCVAGDPTSNCIIQRQPVTLTNSACTPCSSAMGSDYSATTHAFTQTSGTVNLTAGQYVLCNFDATGGTLNIQSGPVQIFVASPNSTLCSGNGYTETVDGDGDGAAIESWDGGNFIATDGIDNSLKGIVNGVSNAIDPSELQIYDLGDGGGYDNATSVTIGNQSSSALSVNPITEAMVVYAPTSSVNLNTSVCLTLPIVGRVCAGGTFEGSVVGDNTTVTAGTITQDLDIGNYPLYTGVNAFRPVEYVQCDASVTKLTGTSSDLNGC